tara:strand:+ start:1063 stop:1692 length:630 start_codon:yes stop_codon:yes gene_type:complete
MNYPKNSRTARALYDAKKSMEEAAEKTKQANELYEKALRRAGLKDILDEYSIDEIQDIVEEKKEDEKALQEAELEDDIQFVDCENSTDDDIEITDSLSPVPSETYDEIVPLFTYFDKIFVHNECGQGPIRCREILTGKLFHGVVEKDRVFKDGTVKSRAHELHSFFQKVNGGTVWNKKWDTILEGTQYCNNCKLIKVNKKTSWYKCQGH